jgi:hypothetical protein
MYFQNSLKRIIQTFFPGSVLFSLMTLPLIFFSLQVKSQTVENVSATVKGDIIIVTYDLVSNADEVFNVNLYSSKDNFEKPLTLVTGDVGPNIVSGKGKRVEWLAKNEFREYSGNLIFEIRAFLPEAAFDPLELQNFSISEIKSGKSYRLQWTGGKKNENIDIFLFENGSQKAKISTVRNSGKYLWKIPKGKKSSTYQVQLKGETGIVASDDFRIEKGFPFLIVGGGGIVTTGVIIYLLSRDSSTGSGNSSTSELPVPPDPN